jgi:NTP pyrophosphatase (non-canonical NTP hydrolase)
MNFKTYQAQAMSTDQRADGGPEVLENIAVHLLGLAGEAGSVASEYKKCLRDGGSDPWWKTRMREELGDLLWYLAAICEHLGLDLEEVALANLEKVSQRWIPGDFSSLDEGWPDNERLPRRGMYEIRPTKNRRGREATELYFDGERIGNELTDASAVDDGYRYHDVFHIAHSVMLGWSPVARSWLKRKRRSDPIVDENEDGGRAVVVEEGIAALVFVYASKHELLAGINRLDYELLHSITTFAGPLEVGVRSEADWERAILAGYAIFREMVANGGGFVDIDALAGTLTYRANE